MQLSYIESPITKAATRLISVPQFCPHSFMPPFFWAKRDTIEIFPIVLIVSNGLLFFIHTFFSTNKVLTMKYFTKGLLRALWIGLKMFGLDHLLYVQ